MFFLCLSSDSYAETKLKISSQKAETIKNKLKQSRNELTAIGKKEQKALEAFDKTEKKLNKIRNQVYAIEGELENLGLQIQGINKTCADLETKVIQNQAYASRRLTALYKLNRMGRVHLLATAGSFFDFVNRKKALHYILKQDEILLEKLHKDQTQLHTLLERLQNSKAEKHSLELTLKERIISLNDEQKKRSAFLKSVHSEKKLALAAFNSLKISARKLEQTLLALPETKLKRKKLLAHEPAAKPFKLFKGLLSWPVKGKIVSFFGAYRDKKYNVLNFQSGVNIQTERGEPVRAVSGGQVIFSSWFKGFGNMIILDHGEHYYTIYAHLEEMFKGKADFVEIGEVIATTGDSGSLQGPALHFEVRHHGKPMDPLKWIKNNSKE
ncbi:MAG: peptidoglycan DD-metalloendopeptidase family protein [Desulfobacteraceae bacterium]|nr:peptidoglycan DD-metalloendopeptidase family protein [Desulfobacteraceae bacterium]